MYELAEQAARRAGAGEALLVARITEVHGVSSRAPGEALLVGPGGVVAGRLLSGLLDRDIAQAAAAEARRRLLHLHVSDTDAVAAGLACGGSAGVLLEPAGELPAEAWQRLAARRPVTLVTELGDAGPGPTRLLEDPEVPEPVRHAVTANARAGTWTAPVAGAGRSYLVAHYEPPTRLLVVGEGLIPAAVARVAEVLGWTATAVADAGSALAAVEALEAGDGLLVTSHDPDVDVPVLAAAVRGRVGYVGALGSRRTQARRREQALAAGLPADRYDERVHGPAGLDLGADTPAEIAVAVVAEMLASRTGHTGAPLQAHGGPIH